MNTFNERICANSFGLENLYTFPNRFTLVFVFTFTFSCSNLSKQKLFHWHFISLCMKLLKWLCVKYTKIRILSDPHFPVFCHILRSDYFAKHLSLCLKIILTFICMKSVHEDPRTIFLTISFTWRIPENSDSMYSSIFMKENL